MKYIDLTLENIDKKEPTEIFQNLIDSDKNKIIIVTGSWGTGKTYQLKKYFENNEKTSFLRVDNFLSENINQKKVFLLDALDECENFFDDPISLSKKLGKKLNSIEYTKVVIATRDFSSEALQNDFISKIKQKTKNEVSIYDLSNLHIKHIDISQNIIKYDIHKVIVILGSPGSGKTSIFKKYSEDNENTSLLKVKEFLKLNFKTEKILLLDGLDEYRSLENDKVFVVSELGSKLNEIEYDKVIITCRELDWYGDTDRNSLKKQINKNVSVYRVCPLSEDQKLELCTNLNISDPKSFISKYDKYGFLDNPQLFTMIGDIDKKDSSQVIKSKKDLYCEFVRLSKEKNPIYQINEVNTISEEERFRYAGYLACFYLFSNVEIFTDEVLDIVSCESEGIAKDKLQIIIKTNLFNGSRKFIHRSIAEFLAAYYLVNFTKNSNSFYTFIYDFFVRKDRIPTELRGTYAWVCSISSNDKLISIDPYYQSIYGDNSSFDNSFKKKIMKKIRKYSEYNPYFYSFNHLMNLELFYNEELDSFFICEFEKALKLDNHYILYIINIFSSAKKLSYKIILFLKKQLLDKNVKVSIKDYLVEILKEDLDFLLILIQKIESGNIHDKDDDLKDIILNYLYINKISSSEIVKYLSLYSKKTIGFTSYLYRTKYEDKFNLVDNIYKYYKKNIDEDENEYDFVLNMNFSSFCKDYFLETLLLFENKLTSKDIFGILLHFNQYYKKYHTMSYETYRYDLQRILKNSGYKLERLTNELYNHYVDYCLEEGKFQELNLHHFKNFFSYSSPTNQSQIIFSKMNKSLDMEMNKILFNIGVSASRNKDGKILFTAEIGSISNAYGFEQELEYIKNPPKQKWQIKQEKRIRKEKKKTKKLINENEKYYKELSDDEILSNFNALNYVAKMIYFKDDEKKSERFLKKKTFNRIKTLLQKLIYVDLISPELTTIESLVEVGDARRGIDTLYYVSTCLNEKINFDILSNEFKNYLYINCLYHKNIGNISKSNFLKECNQNNLESIKILLKEYIYKITENNGLEKDTFQTYIQNEEDIEKLENIVQSRESNLGTFRNMFLDSFLREYAFSILLDDLYKLQTLNNLNETIKEKIEILIIFNLDFQDHTLKNAVSLYGLLMNRGKNISILSRKIQVKIIYFLMMSFNTEESIDHNDGIQSEKDMCASFLRYDIFNLDDVEIFRELEVDLKRTIWEKRLRNKIIELEQIDTDESYSIYPIDLLRLELFKVIEKNDKLFLFQPNWNGIGLNRLPSLKEIKSFASKVYKKVL